MGNHKNMTQKLFLLPSSYPSTTGNNGNIGNTGNNGNICNKGNNGNVGNNGNIGNNGNNYR